MTANVRFAGIFLARAQGRDANRLRSCTLHCNENRNCIGDTYMAGLLDIYSADEISHSTNVCSAFPVSFRFEERTEIWPDQPCVMDKGCSAIGHGP